jgi:hypothetical protein
MGKYTWEREGKSRERMDIGRNISSIPGVLITGYIVLATGAGQAIK